MKRLTSAKLDAVESLFVAASGERKSTPIEIWDKSGYLYTIKRIENEWQQVNERSPVRIAKQLEPILLRPKRFIVVYGGRGSGKSIGIGDLMLIDMHDQGEKVFCFREFQASIEDSVHSLLTGEYERLALDGFKTQNNIIYHETGGQAKFRGIARNPEGVKSSYGFTRFWVEEAQTISQESLDKLTPTMRAEGGIILFTANPLSSADPFSKRFIVPFKDALDRDGFYEDDLHLIIKMNHSDNPWFPAELEQEREHAYNMVSRALYDHVWEGQFNDHVPDSIIEAEWFDACVDAHIKLGWREAGAHFVAHDPADSGDAKATAHRHGSVIKMVNEETTGDANSACDWATDYAAEVGAQVFVWDAQGVGLSLRRQINDCLLPKKIELVEFFGSAAVENKEDSFDNGTLTNGEAILNLRAQRYWQLRQRCYKTYRAVVHGEYCDPAEMISFSSEGINIPALRSEMCRIPRKRTGSGVFQVVSKDDMKKKLKMKSPNMTDAVIMTLCDYNPIKMVDYSNFNIPSTGW